MSLFVHPHSVGEGRCCCGIKACTQTWPAWKAARNMYVAKVELDLRNGCYRLYRKPDSSLLYVNSKSNHPPSVLKQIPQGIAKRLSDISSSKEIFDAAVPEYKEALRRSGYDDDLKYEKSSRNPKKRRRNIIWYNPPYSANVKTNVGRIFRDLISTHFPVTNS